jgi:hypothetical protein
VLLLGKFIVNGRICDSESPFSWTCGTGLTNFVSVWGSRCPSGKQNTHIFYYLFAGGTAEERQHMQLLEKMIFWYFSHHGIPSGRQNVYDDGAQQFEQLKLAIKTLAFPNAMFRPVS